MAFPFGSFWSAVALPEEGVCANPALQDRMTHRKRTLPNRLVIFIIFCFNIDKRRAAFRTSGADYFFGHGVSRQARGNLVVHRGLKIIQPVCGINFSKIFQIVLPIFAKCVALMNGIMISLRNLKYLSAQKINDADTLLRHARNNGAIYLMGYALELSLKRTISLIFGFAQGFPETGPDFNLYARQINHLHSLNIGIRISNVRQFRIHDLDILLDYSGQRLRIDSLLFSEWRIVNKWTPGNRYVRTHVTAQRAHDFIQAAKLIIHEIS